MNEPSVLKIKGVKRSFGEQKVLTGVDLKIPRGKTTVIIGPSGCGKSVLLKHIIGLLRPDSGSIILENLDVTTMGRDDLKRARMKFGMLFQDAALFDSMSVFENVAFPLREHRRFSEKKLAEKVAEKLAQVGLSGAEHKMPSELSGGMRKRVGLARAIVLDPEIILYDEPTTGLDPLMAESIDELIDHTAKTLHVTSIVISHDIVATLRIADKIAMLHGGKIIFEGSSNDLRDEENPVVQDFIRPVLAPPLERRK